MLIIPDQEVPYLFARAAKKRLDKTKRNEANKQRAVHSMFQHFLSNYETMRMSEKFQNWLMRKVVIERANLFSDRRFIVLLINNKISHCWEIAEFKKMWDTPASTDEVLYEKLYGGYVIRGSALAEVLRATPNLGYFQTRTQA